MNPYLIFWRKVRLRSSRALLVVRYSFHYPLSIVEAKNLFLVSIAALFCFACGESETVTVTVTNPLGIERSAEMVELPMDELSLRLNLSDTAQIVVQNAEGEQVPCQMTSDGKLIFPASVGADASATYTIQTGTPAEVTVKACGRQYPECMDDLAWENDLVGFRVYGPALQASGERSFGYDLFTKRGTTEPMLEELYAKELDADSRKRVNDCYAVGPTLGAGAAALMVNDTILYPWCYRNYEILDNGPLRFTVKLEFGPLTVKGDSTVIETRVITLDAGSHLNRTAVSYTNLQETLPIATGIVLHEPDGTVKADAENSYVTYVDPTTGADNGKIFIGAAFPAVVKEAKTVLFPEAEKKRRDNADGHVLAISDYEPGSEYIYYWGFGWNRADIKDIDAWNRYMADFAQKVREPLKVSF